MKKIVISIITVIATVSCNFLDPLDRGMIDQSGVENYPSYVRGYLENCYTNLTKTYLANEYAYFDGATDNGVITTESNVITQFAKGILNSSSDPFYSLWSKYYKMINYANLFLEDNLGYNTKYDLEEDIDKAMKRRLQGEAFAMRAWSEFSLLRLFGGETSDGRQLGFIIRTDATNFKEIESSDLKRDTYEECVKQIIQDCDSALVYLPSAYRDQISTQKGVNGSIGFHRLDGISVLTIKALTYLQWASPAFNKHGDTSRWEKAAEYAAEAIKLKLAVDGPLGFVPNATFNWNDPNSAEVIFSSVDTKGNQYERSFYPAGQGGLAYMAPSQELVDAFPMANGYPLTDIRSGYDSSNPYEGRDPRFYENVYYHQSKIGTLYTIDASMSGADAPGSTGSTRTGYFIRKFTYNGYDKDATAPITMALSVLYLRWTHLLLAYAEASNQAFGPNEDHYGCSLSPKDAIAAIRGRKQFNVGESPLASSDPYLEECATDKNKFDELVRNERRIETCFEGLRFFDLQRWSSSAAELNGNVSGAKIEGSNYGTQICETHKFQSQWLPIPFVEAKSAKNVEQNAGWEAWR